MHLCEDCKYYGTRWCPRSVCKDLDRIVYEIQYTDLNFATMRLCPGLAKVVMKALPEDERKQVLSYRVRTGKLNLI